MVIAINIVKIIILLTSIKMDAYQHIPAKNLPNIFQQEDIVLNAIYSSIKILIALVDVFKIVVINHPFYFKMELVYSARTNLIAIKFLQALKIRNEYLTYHYLMI